MARKQSELEMRRVEAESPSNDTVIKRRGYYIDKLIGFGSYADVYKLVTENESPSPTGVIACKIINANKAPKEYIDRFLPRELEILGKVSHPNIIHIVSVIQRAHKFFIFMRYAEKGDLLEYLLSYGHLSERQARIWFRQIMLAVGYLHQLNIAHRDIKCENILVTEKYNLKLTDFGFARFTIDSQGKQKMSQTYCGSLGYAPPEILKGKSYDPKSSDIWSTGVVLFVMLNRSMPFYGNSVRYLYKQQIDQKWQLNQNVAKLISNEAKELITNMLVPISKKRLKTEEVLDCNWFKMDKRLIDDPNMALAEETEDLRPIKKNRLNMGGSKEIKLTDTRVFTGSSIVMQLSTVKGKMSDAKEVKLEMEAHTLTEDLVWKSGE